MKTVCQHCNPETDVVVLTTPKENTMDAYEDAAAKTTAKIRCMEIACNVLGVNTSQDKTPTAEDVIATAKQFWAFAASHDSSAMP